MTSPTSPVIDMDKWYLRCNPAEMAENYCRAAEATLIREGIIELNPAYAEASEKKIGAHLQKRLGVLE